jgi:hypothetical protein
MGGENTKKSEGFGSKNHIWGIRIEITLYKKLTGHNQNNIKQFDQ